MAANDKKEEKGKAKEEKVKEEKGLMPIPDGTAKELNESVYKVTNSDGLIGFEKSYLIASTISKLKQLLTPEYMKPIMELQGNRLGFKTDKDKDGGYKEDVVKNCLIEAVLTGVQPFGNQFNIIAGGCYITKEGFGHLLSKIRGLQYQIIPALPRINTDKTSAACSATIKWTLNGIEHEQVIDLPIKVNQYIGVDAIIGKCLRKCRAWLYNTISDIEITDGDVTDVEGRVVGSSIPSAGKSYATLFEKNTAASTDVTPQPDIKTPPKEEKKGGGQQMKID